MYCILLRSMHFSHDPAVESQYGHSVGHVHFCHTAASLIYKANQIISIAVLVLFLYYLRTCMYTRMLCDVLRHKTCEDCKLVVFVYLLFPCHGGGGAEEVNRSAVLRNEDDNQFGT